MTQKDRDGFGLTKAKKISSTKRKKLIQAAETKIGRSLKLKQEKYKPISLKLHPDVYSWAKKVARKKGIGYQTFINETLLEVKGKKAG